MAVALLGRLLCVAVLVSSSSAQESPTNIAINKTAKQSSTFSGTDEGHKLTYTASANLAVDGAPTKNYPDKTCALTEWLAAPHCTNNPWWQVDLGGLYDVFNVTIYQRSVGVPNFGPLVVRVGDRVERPENRTVYNDRAVVPVPLSPPETASTVNISIPGCSIIVLCEVEIFAVAYVNECASNPCQHGGSCADGLFKYTCTCLPGYTGVSCDIDIDECGSSPCFHNSLCVDGVNNYTCYCAPGYTGFNCLRPCSGGTYGPGCSVACSAYCPESSDRGGQHCDRTTGQCLLQTGCKDGFQGLQCDTKQQSCPAVPGCTDRYTEGVGLGLGTGLGTSLLLAVFIFVVLRWKRRRNSPHKGVSADAIQLSAGKAVAATGQEMTPGQDDGFYMDLDASSKDMGHSGPYAELGEARGGHGSSSP